MPRNLLAMLALLLFGVLGEPVCAQAPEKFATIEKGGAPQKAPAPQKPAAIEKHSGHLDVSGGKIYYEECGSGASIVLLHDGLMHSVTWDAVWEPLCRKYHVVRYDRRGYGRSDVPKAQFSPTEDLQKLLAQLSVQQAVVAGNSSGASLAIDFALAHPESVEGLFLIGPVVNGKDVSQSFVDRGRKNNEPLENGDVKAAAENWSNDPYIIGERHDGTRKKLRETLADNPQNLKYTGEFEIPNEKPSVSRLGEIHVPTLILVGEMDISDVHGHAGAIEEGIAGAQRDVIINSGHLVQLEQSEIVVEKLSHFTDLQERKSVDVPADALRTYVGQYNSRDGAVIVGFANGHLTLQMPGQAAFPLFAETPTRFFLKVSEVEIGFTKTVSGKVTQAILYQDGGERKVPRNDAPAPKQ
ncbi:MAG TPA: alpha/beta fold hydrolase [Candidatus Eisenbacteria bacterium]|nr:alpha/beta fold hydrolase [Candidatus Eisenbacteria bacterium]